MSLVRRTGFLAPTQSLRHPLVNALIRIIIPLMPIAIEYFENWARQQAARKRYEAEAAKPMSKPLKIDEAKEVLAVDLKCEGANKVPFPVDSEARKMAEKNFKKFFAMCQPEIAEANPQYFFGEASSTSTNEPEGKSTEKKGFAPIPKNDYLAGKFSGAYRILVDENWDKDLKSPTSNSNQQQQQEQHQQSQSQSTSDQQHRA